MTNAKRLRNGLAAIGLLLLALSCYVQFISGYFGDKQWELLYARMWLSGDRLYLDIFPVSPPLIFWLYAIPAYCAHLLGFLRDYEMLVLMGLALCALSIGLSTRLIAENTGFAERHMQWAFAALLCFVLIFRTTPDYFLDREHLFLILVFPYLTRYLPSLASTRVPRRVGIVCGLMAGIGFCVKPYCLAVLVGTQLISMLTQRTWRVALSLENTIIYATGSLYLLLVWFITPEYFHLVVPMAMAAYSSTRDENPVLLYAVNALVVLVPLLLLFRPRYASPYRRDIYYLAALLPFFFLYALLNNNWAYTYYPLTSMSLILAGFMLREFLYLSRANASRVFPSLRLWLVGFLVIGCFEFRQSFFLQHVYGIACLFACIALWEYGALRRRDRARSFPHWTLWAGSFACCMCFTLKAVIMLHFFYARFHDRCAQNIHCQHDDQFLAELGKRANLSSFGTISVEFGRWTRISDFSGAVWSTRFPQLWMLPKFLVSDSAFKRDNQWILDYTAEALADDLDTRKPEVIFVDDANIIYGKYAPVDMVAYFSFHPHFAQALSHYRLERRIDECGVPGNPHPVYKSRCSYYIYRRKQALSP